MSEPAYGARVVEDPPPDLTGNAAGDRDPWQCEICGGAVPGTKDGRKPRLMLCEDHRKSRTRGGGGGAGSGATTPRNTGLHNRIAEGMTALHGMAGFAVTMVSVPTRDEIWQRDGQIIADNSGRIGEAWAKYADNNPKLQKAILKFLDTAGTLSIVGAYAPVAMGIAMNHRASTVAKAQPAPRPAPAPMAPASEPMPTPTAPPGGGGVIFQPSSNGNGLPFATDVIE